MLTAACVEVAVGSVRVILPDPEPSARVFTPARAVSIVNVVAVVTEVVDAFAALKSKFSVNVSPFESTVWPALETPLSTPVNVTLAACAVAAEHATAATRAAIVRTFFIIKPPEKIKRTKRLPVKEKVLKLILLL
jgi:hypothetical protein